jgi:hypothetical protein
MATAVVRTSFKSEKHLHARGRERGGGGGGGGRNCGKGSLHLLLRLVLGNGLVEIDLWLQRGGGWIGTNGARYFNLVLVIFAAADMFRGLFLRGKIGRSRCDPSEWQHSRRSISHRLWLLQFVRQIGCRERQAMVVLGRLSDPMREQAVLADASPPRPMEGA